MMQLDTNHGESTGSLAQIQQLFAKLDTSERIQHLSWTLRRCVGCGRENTPKVPGAIFHDCPVSEWPDYFFWCKDCMHAFAEEMEAEAAERERMERENGAPLD